MRRPISLKSDTCTEGMHVDMLDIRGKVSAQYPGRSVDLFRKRDYLRQEVSGRVDRSQQKA